ncbi:MAG: acyl-CoA dehydrogenase family protein [Robiginitomaculum sp.]
MGLLLNEDEIMLRDMAEGFFKDKAPVAQMRALRDSRDADGYDRALWAEMAEMGFAGVLIDEEHGGNGMGYMAAGLIAEEIGRNLSATPFLSTAILAATAISKGASEAQKAQWLPKIADGSTLMALAVDEGGKHNISKTAMTAEKSGNGFKLSGSKAMVIDGHVADQLIVVARTSGIAGEAGGLSLFLVAPKAGGVSIERTIMADSRNAARIDFDGVEVSGDALIGAVDGGGDILAHVMKAGRAALSAELLGAGEQAFSLTLDYIKERKQFGKTIGEFQALQHRAAHMYSEIEVARSAVLAALTALDNEGENAELYVSMAKAKLGVTAKHISLEGIQLHGGVGMTDEYDIGLFSKRIRVAQELFGDANYHLGLIATAKGF